MDDKYICQSPPLSDYEKEILTILIEECLEVGQAACKLIRFGKESHPDTGVPNDQHLGIEIGELQHMMRLARLEGIIHFGDELLGRSRKAKKLARYLQSNKPASQSRTADLETGQTEQAVPGENSRE